MHHDYNIERSLSDLINFAPVPDSWSAGDKVLFEQAFSLHGKNFHRVKQMLPDKSIGTLVRYYYSWKKTRYRSSYVDRHAMRTKSESDHSEESDDEENDGSKTAESGKALAYCLNCRMTSQLHFLSARGSLCNQCYQHWKRTGTMRDVGGALGTRRRRLGGDKMDDGTANKGLRCPPGIHLSKDDLDMLGAPDHAGDELLDEMAKKVRQLKDKAGINRHLITNLKQKNRHGIDPYRIPEEPKPKPNYRWSQHEIMHMVQGVRRYGKNFSAISDVIGNKTEGHVRSFYQTHREKYSLDVLVEEHDEELRKAKLKREEVIEVIDEDDPDECLPQPS